MFKGTVVNPTIVMFIMSDLLQRFLKSLSDKPWIRWSFHAPTVYIWISELGQPLQSYFGLYRQFTITKAAE